MMKRMSGWLLTATVLASLPASGAVLGYTNLASWQAATTGTIVTETFTNTLLPTTVQTQVPNPNTHGSLQVGNGVWGDAVSATNRTTWSYTGGPLYGFGANWDLGSINGEAGARITINLAGGGTQIVNLYDTNAAVVGLTGGFAGSRAGSFFGFVSDVAITSFTIDAPTGNQFVEMDNLAVNPVPEPATLGLVGLALAGLGSMRFRRRR